MIINWNNNLTWTVRLSNEEMQELFLLLQTRKIYPGNRMIKAIRQQLHDKEMNDRKWMTRT